MESKNIKYVERIDHLRFLAAATVVMFHCLIMTGGPRDILRFVNIPVFSEGHTGVMLFMVLSGMILGMIAYEKELIVGKFYLNRILRIYPLFMFIVTLGYFSTPDPRPPSTGISYLLSLLPISNLYRGEFGAYGGHLWSIPVELQFYLLFPFIHRFAGLYGRRYLWALVVGMPLLRLLMFTLNGTIHHLAYFSIFGALDIFVMGYMIGTAYAAGQIKLRSTYLFPVGFVAFNLIIYFLFSRRGFFHINRSLVPGDVSRHILWVFWPTIQGIAWAFLIITYLQWDVRIPLSRLWARLGEFSYSIYVWHILVITLLKTKDLLLPSPYLNGLLALAATSAVSAVSYYLIEYPILNLRYRYAIAPGRDQVAPVSPKTSTG